jgi:hypothetical protein
VYLTEICPKKQFCNFVAKSALKYLIYHMGSHTWVRDEKRRDGGKSFAVGVPAVVPQPPPPKKRKLVWQRDTSTGASKQQGQAKTTQPSSAAPVKPHDGDDSVDAAPAGADAAKVTADRKAELEELRMQLERRKRALQESSQLIKNAERQRQAVEEADREARRRKLEAGFSAVFTAARKNAAADIASARAPIVFADEVEVNRVLEAPSDYAVLRLAPGVDGATVRKRYREMAVQLHPDKCSVPRASDAFHRLVKAYQQLVKYTK